MLSVAFSPDGRRLACGAMDGTVAVFDVPSGKLLHMLTGHHKPVRDLSFTPGARRAPIPGTRMCQEAALQADGCSGNGMESANCMRPGPRQLVEQELPFASHLLAE